MSGLVRGGRGREGSDRRDIGVGGGTRCGEPHTGRGQMAVGGRRALRGRRLWRSHWLRCRRLVTSRVYDGSEAGNGSTQRGIALLEVADAAHERAPLLRVRHRRWRRNYHLLLLTSKCLHIREQRRGTHLTNELRSRAGSRQPKHGRDDILFAVPIFLLCCGGLKHQPLSVLTPCRPAGTFVNLPHHVGNILGRRLARHELLLACERRPFGAQHVAHSLLSVHRVCFL